MARKDWADYNVEHSMYNNKDKDTFKTGNFFILLVNPFIKPVDYSLYTNISKDIRH